MKRPILLPVLLFLLALANSSSVLAACASEGKLYEKPYLGACSYNQTNGFTLSAPSYVTRIRIWYDTSKVGGSLSATLTGPNGLSMTQTTTKGGCQWTWCEGWFTVNSTLAAGTYSVKASSPYVCANPSGDSTLVVYGCADSAGSTAFDASATASGGDSNLTLTGNVTVASQHVGTRGEVYVAANWGNYWFFNDSSSWSTRQAPYSNGTLPSALTIPIVSGMNLTPLAGLDVYLGYGTSITELVGSSRYKKVYTVSGTPSGQAGTPFVTNVAPSSSTQTVTTTDKKVGLVLPGGTLSQTEKLTVTPVSGRSDTTLNRFTNLGVYDIALEKTNQFQSNVTLEFSYDPAILDPGLQGGAKFVTAYYDETRKKWITQRNSVDSARNKVVVKTDHLSTWGIWMVAKGYKAYYQKHFTIYYYPTDTLPAAFGSTTISDFAYALGQACETAYSAFSSAGFKMPTYTADVLVIDHDDAQRLAYTGDIEIGIANLKSAEMGYTACAHELFHSVQAETFSLVKAAVTGTHVWLIEGSPDYAAWAVAFSKQYSAATVMEGGFEADYFSRSPFTDEQNHAYQLFYFLKYLDEQRSVRFPGMWNTLTANAGTTSASSAKAFRDYLYAQTTFTFDSLWSDYVDFQFFDPKGDLGWAKFVTTTLLPHPSATLSDTSKSASTTFNLAADHTAEAWRVTSTATTTNGTSKVTIAAATDLPAGLTVDVWVLPGNKQSSTAKLGGAVFKGGLVGSSKSLSIDLASGDGIYVVAKNTATAAKSVSVTASVEAAQTNTGSWSRVLVSFRFPVQANGASSRNIANDCPWLTFPWVELKEMKNPQCTVSGATTGTMAIACDNGSGTSMTASIDAKLGSDFGTSFNWSKSGSGLSAYAKALKVVTDYGNRVCTWSMGTSFADPSGYVNSSYYLNLWLYK